MSTGWKGFLGRTAAAFLQAPSALRSGWQRLGESVRARHSRFVAGPRPPRPAYLVEPRLPSRWVLLATALGLAFAAYLCLFQLPAPTPVDKSFDLPAETGTPKLKEEQRAEAPPAPEPPGPVQPARHEVDQATAVPLPPDARPLFQRAAEPPPPARTPMETEPALELIDAMPHEEAPMHKGTFAVQLFLLGWYLSNPVSLAAAEQSAGEAADRLQKIERALEDLKTQTAGLKDVNLKDLKDKVDTISKALEGLDKLPLQVQANKRDLEKNTRDIKDVAEAVAALTEAVTKLQEELKSESRKAFSPAVPRDPPAIPSTGASTLRLVNAWSTPMTVIVDDMSYRLQPGEVRNLPKKAGNVTFEVLTVQRAVTRTLVAGETLTVRIEPRQ